TLEIVEILPTRLGAAERLPIEIDLEALGGEEAFLQGDEIIKPHTFWSDRHRSQAVGHGDCSWNSLVELVERNPAGRSRTRSARPSTGRKDDILTWCFWRK